MENYDFKFIEFLCGRNVVKVTNKEEFVLFKQILQYLHMEQCLSKYKTFKDLQHIASINGYDVNILLFEYQNSKGLTFGYDTKQAIEWFGIEPYTVQEIYDEVCINS